MSGDGAKMEIHCQDLYKKDTGSLNLLQPTWSAVSTLYQEVLKFVNQFPFKRRLVFCFVFRGTKLKIDLGDVKAAGIVCVLGFGFGLGTLLIYKLYYKYIHPIIDRDKDSETSKSKLKDENCCIYLEDSESESEEKMGNAQHHIAPSASYSPQFGVAFCINHNYAKKKREACVPYGLNLIKEDEAVRRTDGVIFRNRRTKRCPSEEHSDKDSAIGGASDLAQSFYSESGINRDSFYSTCTAESGFENMTESWEENSSVSGRYPFRYRHPSSTHSMNVNFSPKSLKEKNSRYISENALGYSSDSLHSFDVLEKSSLLLTPPSDEEKSPAPVETKTSDYVYQEKRNSFSAEPSERSQSDFDQLIEGCESLKSFSCGTNSVGDWSCDDEGEGLSPLPRPSLTEYQFKQSVLQRLHEWSSFSSENYTSRSPTPDRLSCKRVRRSRSLDRNIFDCSSSLDNEIFENAAIDFEDKTTKNLEHIEDELHDIQDEFSVITTKLSDLIHQGSVSSEKSESETRTLTEDVTLSPKTVSVLQRAWSRWERSPSVSLDSNHCSREGSVDLAWDMCELADSQMPRRLRSSRTHRLKREDSRLSNSGINSNNNSNADDEANDDVSIAADVCADSSLPSDNLQTDSAEEQPHESKGLSSVKLTNIRNVVDIKSYAENEWKGKTAVAETIKQGYAEIAKLFNCCSLRQTRGDNYCAVRSCLFQVLTSGINVTHRWCGIVDLVNHLEKLYKDSASGLAKWNFANRLPCSADGDTLSVICKCVFNLYSAVEKVGRLSTQEEREKLAVSLFNSDPNTDLELVEGVKIMMLVQAYELYQANCAGQDVPVFVWLLFARDTSETVDKFVTNHLNSIGDSGGLEQVEMCLLGHTLGTKIRVARLQNHGQEDFICQFPDDADPSWPHINLLAEDDRHYNIPVP